jgi:biopolymer transport protein ExbB
MSCHRNGASANPNRASPIPLIFLAADQNPCGDGRLSNPMTDFAHGYPQILGITCPAFVRRVIAPRRAGASPDRIPGLWLVLHGCSRYSSRLDEIGVSAVFAIIQAAGWPIWPLLLASVVAVALIIERSVSLRRVKVVPPGLLARVVEELRTAQGPALIQLVQNLEAHSPLGRVLAAAIRNRNASRDVMKEAVEEVGRATAHLLERYLTTLGTIASVSPLMGLFGTVVGMIEIFGSQSPSGSNPQQLAHGISIALYNTGFGLMIAIPALICWRHFRALVDSFVVDMEQQAIRLVELLHGERRD